MPFSRRFVASASASLMALDEYAPASPRSAVTTRTAALVRFSVLAISGCFDTSLASVAAALMAAYRCVRYGSDASRRCCAFTMRDEAMSSIAFVIFLVACTDLIRRR